jgi:uncharacterized protein YecE (DUF72 family)
MVNESYSHELYEERQNKRRVTRPWLQCFLCQTPPTFEDCKEHFEEKGMLLTKTDYEDMCKKMHKEPQYRATEKPES